MHMASGFFACILAKKFSALKAATGKSLMPRLYVTDVELCEKTAVGFLPEYFS